MARIFGTPKKENGPAICSENITSCYCNGYVRKILVRKRGLETGFSRF
jgi:hypothetical protein